MFYCNTLGSAYLPVDIPTMAIGAHCTEQVANIICVSEEINENHSVLFWRWLRFTIKKWLSDDLSG